MKKSVFLFLVISFALKAPLAAHSINFEVSRHAPVVTVKAYFTAASPLVNSSVTIYAPGDPQPYQTGRTDKEGYFAFIPAVTGEWTFVIDDEMGHADKIVVNISESFPDGEGDPGAAIEARDEPEVLEKPESEIVSGQSIPTIYRVIFGLVIIFGITGIIYGIKARQELHKNNLES